MRIVLAASMALIAVSVIGCDINTTPKTAQVGCNCTAPPAPPAGMRGSDAYPPPAAPVGYRTHERYHWHGAPHHGTAHWSGGDRSYHWRREYSEMSVFTYDYHSSSTSYTTGGHGGGYGGVSAYAYAAAGSYGGGGAYAGAGAHGGGYAGDPVHADDGYHRVPSGTVGDPAHYETDGRDRHRGDVWHGYDVDCPDPANHR